MKLHPNCTRRPLLILVVVLALLPACSKSIEKENPLAGFNLRELSEALVAYEGARDNWEKRTKDGTWDQAIADGSWKELVPENLRETDPKTVPAKRIADFELLIQTTKAEIERRR